MRRLISTVFLFLLTLLSSTGCTSIEVRIEGAPGAAARIAAWQQSVALMPKCPEGYELQSAVTGTSSVSAVVRGGKVLPLSTEALLLRNVCRPK